MPNTHYLLPSYLIFSISVFLHVQAIGCAQDTYNNNYNNNNRILTIPSLVFTLLTNYCISSALALLLNNQDNFVSTLVYHSSVNHGKF